MSTTQVAFFAPEVDRSQALRERKKLKTRRSIEDAALQLFALHGYESTTVEQIADLAEVSTTTFCRYFPSKADVILGDNIRQLPALQEAILAQPTEVSDLAAVRHALQHAWVKDIDPARTALNVHAIAQSSVLRGLSFDVGIGWIAAISATLARRRAVEAPDEDTDYAARIALDVFGAVVEKWVLGGCSGDLGQELDVGFDRMERLCREWARPSD